MAEQVDLLIVGGGINGVGIARDAAGRGVSTWLCEQADLANFTSSASTKLIHGGLRYLEQYEFRLVSKALAEREVLLKMAPHIVWPMRFVLPHERHLRPAWMIRAGLFLYDHLGRGQRTLAGSAGIDLDRHPAGSPLRDEFHKGFVYSDACTQDARLVVLNAMDAAARGARILPRTRCESADRAPDGWQIRLRAADGRPIKVKARALVNATGPWAVHFLDDVLHLEHAHTLRSIKGSHIIAPKLFNHSYAYIFQQPDARIVFAIPYEHNFTLIGTTDIDYTADPACARIDDAEIAYLCDAVNRYFKQSIGPDDVVWSYSGVRPLVDDQEDSASEVTRDYQLELDEEGAPLLSVFGGKLTTFRRLAEDAVDRLAPILNIDAPAWTAEAPPLPGGGQRDMPGLLAALQAEHPWLPDTLLTRWVYTYGGRTRMLLGEAGALADLGECFGSDLYCAEVEYLHRYEWAESAEDILWRRTKLGLSVDAGSVARLAAYLHDNTKPDKIGSLT
jgi:glycerol-3-phosphate dehydrogenase